MSIVSIPMMTNCDQSYYMDIDPLGDYEEWELNGEWELKELKFPIPRLPKKRGRPFKKTGNGEVFKIRYTRFTPAQREFMREIYQTNPNPSNLEEIRDLIKPLDDKEREIPLGKISRFFKNERYRGIYACKKNM